MSRLLSIAAGVHPDLAPADMIDVAAAAGWPACGIWFDGGSWTAATAIEVRRRLDDTGVVALDLEPIIPAPGVDDHGEQLIDAAAELGARHALFTSRLPELAPTADRFAALCERASDVGVTLVCEFLPIFPLATLAMALEVVSPYPPSVAGVLVDNLHLARSGGTPDDLAGIDPARLPYVQVADAPAAAPASWPELLDEAMNGRLLPGAGALPIDALLRRVPGVPISFEVRSRTLRDGWPDPVARARHLLDAVRRLSLS